MTEARASNAPPPASAWEDQGAQLGARLLARLHGVMRGLKLYDSSNQTLRGQLDELQGLIASGTEDELTLLVMGDHFYLNGAHLRPPTERVKLYRSLMAEFEVRALCGLRFLPGLAASELETFLKLFVAARDGAQGERLTEDARALGILHVEALLTRDVGVQVQSGDDAEAQGSEGERQRARRIFWRAVRGMENLVARTNRTGRPALHQARRLVQPVVDSILKNEYSIIGLTALKDHDEYTYAHCVNVSVLSIGMGQALGLPRQTLASLGVAALLHDLGKLAVPSAVLQKPGRLSAPEWDQIQRHPLEGAKMMCQLPGLSTLTLDAMRVAFQHHMNVDRSGYPKLRAGSAPATLSRLVAVADFFDAVTSHRAYRARPFTSFEAIHVMLRGERQRFDPAAQWALLRTVGFYPAGTLMLTESHHIVLSLSPNPADPRRPNCRVLRQPGMKVLNTGSTETWNPMPAQEKVIGVLDPESVGVEIGTLLAA